MREVVAQLKNLVAELSSDVMVVVKDDDPKKRDSLAARLENFLYQIRNNESIHTFVHRRDEPGKVTMLIGVSDHEAKDAIVKALWTRAEKEAGRAGIRVWTKELKSDVVMRSAAELQRVARLIGVHE
jgi:hypothetical protein